MQILLATKAFFTVLLNREKAKAIESTLQSATAQSSKVPSLEIEGSFKPREKPVVKPTTPTRQHRSEAITLLSTLQRDARFLDLVQESLEQYSDAQIGAAARDVLRETRKCLEKHFGIQPLLEASEGQAVHLPESPSPVRWKVVGNAKEEGVLVHPGWIATKTELPAWTGSVEDSLVLAPAEVES
jgi:hypothetical protein